MTKRVYISGAITGTDDYLKRFAIAEDNLQCMGYEVINPAAVCARLPTLKHKQYLDICISMLKACNTIYMLKGWEKSKGAKTEYTIASVDNYKVMME